MGNFTTVVHSSQNWVVEVALMNHNAPKSPKKFCAIRGSSILAEIKSWKKLKKSGSKEEATSAARL